MGNNPVSIKVNTPKVFTLTWVFTVFYVNPTVQLRVDVLQCCLGQWAKLVSAAAVRML